MFICLFARTTRQGKAPWSVFQVKFFTLAGTRNFQSFPSRVRCRGLHIICALQLLPMLMHPIGMVCRFNRKCARLGQIPGDKISVDAARQRMESMRCTSMAQKVWLTKLTSQSPVAGTIKSLPLNRRSCPRREITCLEGVFGIQPSAKCRHTHSSMDLPVAS